MTVGHQLISEGRWMQPEVDLLKAGGLGGASLAPESKHFPDESERLGTPPNKVANLRSNMLRFECVSEHGCGMGYGLLSYRSWGVDLGQAGQAPVDFSTPAPSILFSSCPAIVLDTSCISFLYVCTYARLQMNGNGCNRKPCFAKRSASAKDTALSILAVFTLSCTI